MQRLNGVGDASISELKAKAPDFLQRLETMRADAARTGNQDAIDLTSYGDTLKSIIEGFTGAMDTASNVMDSIAYGLTHPFGYALPGLSGLSGGMGILPVLAAGELVTLTSIAGASAAAVAVTYYITKADRLHADLMAQEWQAAQDTANSLKAQGDVAGAQKVIDDFNRVQVATQPQSMTGLLTTVASAALVIGLVYLAMKGRK